MSLKQIIKEKHIQAMKERDIQKKDTYENILVKITLEEKSGKYNNSDDIPDNVIENIIIKQIKETKDLLQYYSENENTYSELLNRINELKQYVPEELSEDEVREIIQELIELNGNNKGKIIAETIKKVSGRFDKSKVAKLVNDALLNIM